jgi:hypothetical protein
VDEPDVPDDVPLELEPDPNVSEPDEPEPELFIEPDPEVDPPTDELPDVLPPALEPLDSANAGAAKRIRAEAATASLAVFIVSSNVVGFFPRPGAEGCRNYESGRAGFRRLLTPTSARREELPAFRRRS